MPRPSAGRATDLAALIESDAALVHLLESVRRVAVLGIKTAAQAEQPAYEVPRYLCDQGLEVIPVPVYFPGVQSILGRPVFRSLQAVSGPVDLVDVFRRPQDLDAHLDDLLACGPRAVWLQLGIRHDAFAGKLVEAGIDVVQDRCLMVEHRRLLRRGAGDEASGSVPGR